MLGDYESHYKDLLEISGMSTLNVGRLRSAMCEVFKAINDTGSEYLKKYFTFKDQFYETCAVVPKFKSVKFGAGSLSHEGAIYGTYYI